MFFSGSQTNPEIMKTARPLPSICATCAAAAVIATAAMANEPPSWTPLLPHEMELDSMFYLSTVYTPWETERLGTPGELTDDDYAQVAARLGVETAAIKAVVDVETGRKHLGFYDVGCPVINFDLSVYRTQARRHGVDLGEVQRQAPEVFRAPDSRKYGSRQLAQQARLDAAAAFNDTAAYEGTFWGMFQIGGFNWKLLGKESVHEFVEQMRRSERDQLELFADFCLARGLVKYIRAKDWDGFSLRYNGPSYAENGYQTKMAAAYRRFSR